MPRVCVVIPTYNRRALLARAVESVTRQTYSDWELRIIDDGSTDGSHEWLEDLAARDSRIITQRQKNQGVSRSRNRAIFATQSKWTACLDSDDEWLPDKLAKQIAFAAANPNIRLIHGEEIWLRNGKRLNPLKKHRKSGGRIFLRCLPICCISPSTVMIQTELVKRLGGFREDFAVCEDYDLWLKICASEDVGFISDPLIIKHGGHSDQLSHRFKAMDEYRVRALWDIRNHPSLSLTERLAVIEELLKKSEILINGYRKYAKETDAERIRVLQTDALAQLHHLKSACSAADFAPRSDATGNLNGN